MILDFFSVNINVDIPKWTDIAQVFIGGVGVVITAITLYKLFLKDAQKQEQINKLSTLVSKFDIQNQIMKEGNTLLESHLQILRQEILGGESKTSSNELLARIEEQKYLLSMRPRLFPNGGRIFQNNVNFLIENFGETAFLFSVLDLINDSKLLIVTAFSENLEIKKDGYFNISTVTRSGKGWNEEEINFRFEIKYKDIAGNLYKQEIYGIVSKSYKTTDPELLEKTIK